MTREKDPFDDITKDEVIRILDICEPLKYKELLALQYYVTEILERADKINRKWAIEKASDTIRLLQLERQMVGKKKGDFKRICDATAQDEYKE